LTNLTSYQIVLKKRYFFNTISFLFALDGIWNANSQPRFTGNAPLCLLFCFSLKARTQILAKEGSFGEIDWLMKAH